LAVDNLRFDLPFDYFDAAQYKYTQDSAAAPGRVIVCLLAVSPCTTRVQGWYYTKLQTKVNKKNGPWVHSDRRRATNSPTRYDFAQKTLENPESAIEFNQGRREGRRLLLTGCFFTIMMLG